LYYDLLRPALDHDVEPFRATPKKIYDDVLDAIGNTPMIKINKVGVDAGI